jgi:hypothetical protein
VSTLRRCTTPFSPGKKSRSTPLPSSQPVRRVVALSLSLFLPSSADFLSFVSVNARSSSSAYDSTSHSSFPIPLKGAGDVAVRPAARFGLQSLAVQVQVDVQHAIEVDSEAQMGAGTARNDARYAVRFDDQGSEKGEKGGDVEMARYA